MKKRYFIRLHDKKDCVILEYSGITVKSSSDTCVWYQYIVDKEFCDDPKHPDIIEFQTFGTARATTVWTRTWNTIKRRYEVEDVHDYELMELYEI